MLRSSSGCPLRSSWALEEELRLAPDGLGERGGTAPRRLAKLLGRVEFQLVVLFVPEIDDRVAARVTPRRARASLEPVDAAACVMWPGLLSHASRSSSVPSPDAHLSRPSSARPIAVERSATRCSSE